MRWRFGRCRGELRHIHYHDVRDALLAIPRRDFVIAIALTALNYVVLLAYDWVSVRYLRLPLGMGKTALASFIGHVSSFNFGAVLGGTPVRYRLYTAFGLSGGDVLKLIALSTATFWIGFLALAGLMFLWDPLPLPTELHMPFHTTHADRPVVDRDHAGLSGTELRARHAALARLGIHPAAALAIAGAIGHRGDRPVDRRRRAARFAPQVDATSRLAISWRSTCWRW